ncbi:MAG TPA: 1-acyl-sn-glycerol-3-phosphate acyltransferase, partial [Verrucomicrobium sp.]|nr:1-acyl-sn-glycerol-3-phosphate acyltransferase [Verrucomicrobium sp.]
MPPTTPSASSSLSPTAARRGSGWHAAFHRLISWLYFDRVTVTGREHLPAPDEGPVLFLCLHRNGAVDAFVYHALLAPTRFMVSVQLCRSWFGRLFFTGIQVVRDKDRAKTPDAEQINQQAMRECQTCLAKGGRLTIFPEGTSTLGPSHLPFRGG